MTISARDYGWVDDEDSPIPHEYCMTLVKGLAPEEFLSRIGATPVGAVQGLEHLGEELWSDDADEAFVGVTSVDGWALGLEFNGFLGVSPKVYGPLSTGTRLVSHFRNVNAHMDFVWVEDGDVRVSFDPLFPADRFGSTPDALNKIMARIGFQLETDEEDDDGASTDGAYALAEHLTGIRVDPALLRGCAFQVGRRSGG